MVNSWDFGRNIADTSGFSSLHEKKPAKSFGRDHITGKEL
jgi:hypothetical protein